MRRTLSLWTVIAVVAAGLAGWFGRAVPVAQQWSIFSGLLTTSSIVFGVVGLWLALIYPEVLQTLSQWRQSRHKQAQRVTRLFEPLVESAIVVGTVALITLIYPIATQFPLRPQFLPPVRGASLAVAAILTVLQFRALYGAIAPLIDVGRKVLDEEEDARVRSGFPEPELRQASERPRITPVG